MKTIPGTVSWRIVALLPLSTSFRTSHRCEKVRQAKTKLLAKIGLYARGGMGFMHRHIMTNFCILGGGLSEVMAADEC